jgi:hypothetical protein
VGTMQNEATNVAIAHGPFPTKAKPAPGQIHNRLKASEYREPEPLRELLQPKYGQHNQATRNHRDKHT